MTFGIDVSGYQSGIDYTQARREGVEFVIVKAAGFNTGALYVADGYHGHVDAARKAGLCIGHYFVVGKGDPEKQADFFADNLHDFDAAHDVIALDDEPLDDNGTYWKQDDAFKFLTRVHERTGIPWNRLWLYCPAHLTRDNGPWDKITDKGIRVWWSAYGSDPTGHEPDHEPALNGKIARWDIHQYSSSVPVAGRTVDANYSNIPCSELFGGPAGSRPAWSVTASVKPSSGEHRYTSTEVDGIPGPQFYKLMQLWAREDGYTGPIDGVLGKNTWAAIQRGRKRWDGYDGPCDGIPGVNTYKALQRAAQHGGYDGPIDGVLGKNSYRGLAKLLNGKFA